MCAKYSLVLILFDIEQKQYTVSFDKLYKLDHLAAHDNILLQNLLINITIIDEFHIYMYQKRLFFFLT